MLTVRRAALAAAALTALLLPASSATAGIWTPIASGTTSNITAIDDGGPGLLIYGTASGQILKNGVVKATNPGFSITDIKFNPSHTIALASASNGRLLRSANAGDTWATVSLANSTYNQSPA